MSDNTKYGHNETTQRQRSWDVRESKTAPDTFAQGRVDLNPAAFDNLIKQKGMNCKVYRTMYCPNVKSVDGAEHQIDCDLCNGSGWIDVDPIKTQVFIQTQELDKLPKVEGLVDGNTVMMTFPIGVELQYFTLIELTDFTNIYFQRVMRNPDSVVDVLKYKACRINVLIDSNGTRYFADSDFTLTLDGSIKWLNGTEVRTISFGAIPTSGQWSLKVSPTQTVGPFDSSTTIVELADAINGATDIDVSVSGDYASGFAIGYGSYQGTSPIPRIYVVQNTLLDSSSAPVTTAVTNSLSGGRHPDNGQPYSVHYEAPQQFRASAASHVNRYTQFKSNGSVEFIKMNEQWYCAKEFLPKREDKQGNEIEQGPYSQHDIVEGEGDNE